MCRIDPNNFKILETSKITDLLPEVRTVIAHPHIDEGLIMNYYLLILFLYIFIYKCKHLILKFFISKFKDGTHWNVG